MKKVVPKIQDIKEGSDHSNNYGVQKEKMRRAEIAKANTVNSSFVGGKFDIGHTSSGIPFFRRIHETDLENLKRDADNQAASFKLKKDNKEKLTEEAIKFIDANDFVQKILDTVTSDKNYFNKADNHYYMTEKQFTPVNNVLKLVMMDDFGTDVPSNEQRTYALGKK